MDIQTASHPRPNVTLVVPNYNHARYLPESLGSIAGQTRAPDRVLIIDDASTDDSLAVIARFVADHPGWELIRHDKNRGVVRGQNEAIRAADTDWIGFLGADDVLHPTYLEKALDQAAQFPDAGLICACCEIIGTTETRALRPMILPAPASAFLSPDDVRRILLAGDNYFAGTVSLYRRSALQVLGGFDENLGSFADAFLARQLALTFGFFFVSEILGYWRLHGQNFSMTTVTDPAALSAQVARIQTLIAHSDLFPPGYANLFDRRTRFGAARLVMSADTTPTARAERAAALLQLRTAERRCLRLLLSLGGLGQITALAWTTLRNRPMSLLRLASQINRRRAIIAACPAYQPA
jgi:glycosyltransferase involved in cell wall biosynthesis